MRARTGILAAGLATVFVGAGAIPALASTDTVPVTSQAVRMAMYQAGAEVMAGIPLRCNRFRRFVDAPRWGYAESALGKPGCQPYDGGAIFKKRSDGWKMITWGNVGFCPDLVAAPRVVREWFACEY